MLQIKIRLVGIAEKTVSGANIRDTDRLPLSELWFDYKMNIARKLIQNLANF